MRNAIEFYYRLLYVASARSAPGASTRQPEWAGAPVEIIEDQAGKAASSSCTGVSYTSVQKGIDHPKTEWQKLTAASNRIQDAMLDVWGNLSISAGVRREKIFLSLALRQAIR